MKFKLILFAVISFFFFFGFSEKASAGPGALFCVCTQNCGGGILQCLYPGGRLVNEGPCNTQPCQGNCNPTIITSCGPCSKACGGGWQTCTNQCGSTGTYSCNTQACGNPPETCGNGTCKPGQEFCTTCPQDCGSCPTPPPAPTPTPNGQYQITEQCNPQGSGWNAINTLCVQNNTCRTQARCNQGRSCGSCGVECGVGLQQCRYTRDETGGPCDAPAGTEPCSSICPPGNSCVANACQATGDPWIQSLGGSMRLDRGFTSRVPATAASGPYASLPGSGGTPGLIFTGDATANFGSGQPSQSPYGWLVGGTTFPNLYAPVRQGGTVKTSYSFLQAKTRQGNITPTDLSSQCSISSCTLPGGLPSGVYIANGNLTLNAYTFPANSNYVILVTGDLRIQGRIIVPVGSTATFSASGNINIDRNVGEGASSTSSSIEGVYSADRNFVIEGINNCTSGADLRFNVGGHIIANATLSGSSFQNQRNLCASNRLYPSVYIKERPDFILNTPEFLKQPNFTYQEIAP